MLEGGSRFARELHSSSLQPGRSRGYPEVDILFSDIFGNFARPNEIDRRYIRTSAQVTLGYRCDRMGYVSQKPVNTMANNPRL
jgi:hypothetical protein